MQFQKLKSLVYNGFNVYLVDEKEKIGMSKLGIIFISKNNIKMLLSKYEVLKDDQKLVVNENKSLNDFEIVGEEKSCNTLEGKKKYLFFEEDSSDLKEFHPFEKNDFLILNNFKEMLDSSNYVTISGLKKQDNALHYSKNNIYMNIYSPIIVFCFSIFEDVREENFRKYDFFKSSKFFALKTNFAAKINYGIEYIEIDNLKVGENYLFIFDSYSYAQYVCKILGNLKIKKLLHGYAIGNISLPKYKKEVKILETVETEKNIILEIEFCGKNFYNKKLTCKANLKYIEENSRKVTESDNALYGKSFKRINFFKENNNNLKVEFFNEAEKLKVSENDEFHMNFKQECDNWIGKSVLENKENYDFNSIDGFKIWDDKARIKKHDFLFICITEAEKNAHYCKKIINDMKYKFNLHYKIIFYSKSIDHTVSEMDQFICIGKKYLLFFNFLYLKKFAHRFDDDDISYLYDGFSISKPRLEKREKFAVLYDYNMINGRMHVKLLLQGFEMIDYVWNVVSNCKYEIKNNEDGDVFSANAYLYSENFITISFEIEKDLDFYITSEQTKLKIKIQKFAKKNSLTSKFLMLENNGRVKVTLNNSFYINEISSKTNKDIFIFQDREDKADDSAEVLYRHYLKNNYSMKNKYFILNEKSLDFQRLRDEGFNLINYGSDEHKNLFYNSSYVISTHAAPKIFNPLIDSDYEIQFTTRYKFIFLQHGVIMHNHKGFLDEFNTKIDLFVCSIYKEKKNVENFSGYKNVVLTGLPRFDTYSKTESSENVILYAPSWNTSLNTEIENSDYFRCITSLISNYTLQSFLSETNHILKVILHPEFNKYINLFEKYNTKNIIFSSSTKLRYSQELSSAKLLITDYSSLLFDMLYQKKPVITYFNYKLHHTNDELQLHKKIVYHFDFEFEVVNKIKEFYEKKFKLPQNRVDLIDELFSIQSNHCKRVIKEIEKLK